jgi:hypothetical protein
MSSYQYQKKSSATATTDNTTSSAQTKAFTNSITKYASAILRGSESKRVDAQLLDSVSKIVSGNAVYIERFHCEENDYQTLERLANDLDRNAKEEEGMINWSKHLKQENPEFSETFRTIVERMAEYFDVDVFATRLNFYRDGSDWKPYHHDSHAFGANGHKEDFTMGASFGAPRALSFLHEPSASSFEFPQKNGDVFAFSSEVNAAMKHGVPQLSGQEQFENNPRFSVIAWGRRRSLNARNSSVSSSSEKTTIAVDGSRMPWHHNARNDEEGRGGGGYGVSETSSTTKNANERVMSNDEVSELVQKFIKRKRNETRKTSKALVEHLKENKGIDDLDFVRVKKQARKYQRDDRFSAKEFVESALGGCVSVDDLRNLASYLPNEQKKIELMNELNNYSSSLPFLPSSS